MKSSRREFLQSTLTGATLLAGGWSVPTFLARTAFAAAHRKDDRILVIVQLTGGNDGLNTVVPFEDDAYHRARPTLAVAKNQVLRVSDTLGLHPELGGLRRLFDDGMLSVITNVGYENPDRSHFRSMDIWHTADPENPHRSTGWLGRAADQRQHPGAPPWALNLDDAALPLALHAERNATPSITSLDAFHLERRAADLEEMIRAPRAAASPDLEFVQRTAIASCANARRLESVARQNDGSGQYPPLRLAEKLRQIAALIAADFGPRVFYTSLGGFDTHARQALAHGPLLRELGQSVAAFYDDLRGNGLADRVVLMTFSEFGRRVNENAGRGTDHGAAAPMFVVGSSVRAGVIGAPPDLDHLLDGDVAPKTDFRSVYAAVLARWLEIDPTGVLGGRFAPAPIL